jgi:hypothetical protein
LITGTNPLTSEVVSYTTKIFGTPFNLSRINEIAVFIYKNVIVSWYPLLFLFLFCIFINFKNFFRRSSTFFLVIILLNLAFLFYATYIFSFNFSLWSDIPDSAKRMAMFFMPLMIYYIGLSLERKNK